MKNETKNKSKRTTIFLDENKRNFISKIKKEKGLKSTTKVLEYLMDHYQNRLSNHIAKKTENLLLMFYLRSSKKWTKDNEKLKENIKEVYKDIENLENIKMEALKELNDEKKKDE